MEYYIVPGFRLRMFGTLRGVFGGQACENEARDRGSHVFVRDPDGLVVCVDGDSWAKGGMDGLRKGVGA